MKLSGESIDVKLVEERDGESLLKLEVKNKDFFQLFTGLRNGSFYTLQRQVERIKNASVEKENDQGYLFVITVNYSPLSEA
jgi:[ribosomal protein S5]-alanine N-acetyltransferase